MMIKGVLTTEDIQAREGLVCPLDLSNLPSHVLVARSLSSVNDRNSILFQVVLASVPQVRKFIKARRWPNSYLSKK